MGRGKPSWNCAGCWLQKAHSWSVGQDFTWIVLILCHGGIPHGTEDAVNTTSSTLVSSCRNQICSSSSFFTVHYVNIPSVFVGSTYFIKPHATEWHSSYHGDPIQWSQNIPVIDWHCSHHKAVAQLVTHIVTAIVISTKLPSWQCRKKLHRYS